MCDVMSILRDNLTNDEWIRAAHELSVSYDPLMSDSKVWELLLNTLPTAVSEKLAQLGSSELGHRVVNDVVMCGYPGEQVVKYHLAKKHVHEANSIVVFELNVGTSRVDMARINGCSYAYEIKTELDSLARLDSQIKDYEKAFEYTYAIVHSRHTANAIEILPTHCGIIQISDICCDARFSIIREAVKSPFLSSEVQIKSLSSRDLSRLLRMAGISSVQNTRSQRESAVFEALDSHQINRFFKEVLRQKFCSQWQFVRQHFSQLLPIDVELFYHSMADPSWVYYKCSSML